MHHSTPTTPLDPDAYLARIGRPGRWRPDAATLRALHLAHLRAVPFENLDALAGSAPSLDLGDLTAKLVHGRDRGGYCYEHNTLFAAVLEALGFTVTRLAARVAVGAERVEDRPRTHMALLVEVPGEPVPHLADVGFGAAGSLLEPVPLTADTAFHRAGRAHRLVHVPHTGPLELWLLQTRTPGAGAAWEPQYAFTREPFTPGDFEIVNWHMATNPRSPFSRRPYVRSVTPERDLLFHDGALTEAAPDGTTATRTPADEADARRLLADAFGITAPDGVRLLA
ncbi:arylamine N-acetyltransferase [Streptomyces sp. TP-A0875]|uniref:arylamine N-acetyltransferase family protein n=1 Tax=Streptomyces sp. TP-A0875 TaxID=552354 RepID=UPI0006B425CD|nr:arylamine N-acetyltransferase [Streptomyces sp. TP-A0875]